ncbi:glycosyltransferase [Deinococcus antarcticus]|uniref:Glycosyltransferase n=1 Tax=Deinococcus antarcticus TaxID=1298767 RepID=A0ABV8A291_9DEIO
MRIVHVIPSLALGGAERILVSLACEQKKLGKEVAVISIFGVSDSYLQRELESYGIPIYGLFRKTTQRLLITKECLQILLKLNPSVIHCHLQSVKYIILYSLIKHPVLIYTIHGEPSNDSRGFNKIVNQISIILGMKIIAVSKYVASQAENYYRLNKIQVIYNSHDINYNDPIERFKRDDIINIISVARFHLPKRQDLAILAMQSLAEKTTKFSLTFVGDGPERRRAEELVKNLKLEKYIKFVGNSSNVSDFLKDSDIFLHITESEALSVAIQEAMHFGLPIIASQVGGIPELVKDGENGFLINDNEVESISERLFYLIDNPELMEKMSEVSFNKSKEFSVKKMATEYIGIYGKDR